MAPFQGLYCLCGRGYCVGGWRIYIEFFHHHRKFCPTARDLRLSAVTREHKHLCIEQIPEDTEIGTEAPRPLGGALTISASPTAGRNLERFERSLILSVSWVSLLYLTHDCTRACGCSRRDIQPWTMAYPPWFTIWFPSLNLFSVIIRSPLPMPAKSIAFWVAIY